MAANQLAIIGAFVFSFIPCICLGQAARPASNSPVVSSSVLDSSEVASSKLDLSEVDYSYRVVCDEGDYEGPIRARISEATHDQRQHAESHPEHHCRWHLVYDGWQAYCDVEKCYVGKMHSTAQDCGGDRDKHLKDTIEDKAVDSTHKTEVRVPGHITIIQKRFIEVRLKSKHDIPSVKLMDNVFYIGCDILVYLSTGF